MLYIYNKGDKGIETFVTFIFFSENELTVFLLLVFLRQQVEEIIADYLADMHEHTCVDSRFAINLINVGSVATKLLCEPYCCFSLSFEFLFYAFPNDQGAIVSLICHFLILFKY